MAKPFPGRKRKNSKLPYCSCVVVAAGSSERMGGDKMFVELGGVPLIAHTLSALQSCPEISEIVVVTCSDSIVPIADICRDFDIYKAAKIITGGAARTESALSGVLETSEKAELIAIHDGARPLVTPEIVRMAVEAAAEHLAAAPSIPVPDTVKLSEGGFAVKTPDRKAMAAVQTPQVFKADLIKAALASAVENGLDITDDCSAVEELGVRPALTPGSEENLKVTLPLDVSFAELILARRENGGDI